MNRSKMALTVLIFFILLMQGLIYTLIGSGSLFLISSAKVLTNTETNIALIIVTLASILIALWASRVVQKRWGLIFRLGIICNIASIFFVGIETLAAEALPSLAYILFLSSLLLLGAGNGIIFITIPRLIATLFPEKTVGNTIQIFAAPILGNLLAPYVLSLSLYFEIIGLLGIVCALIYFLFLLLFDLLAFFSKHEEPLEVSEKHAGLWTLTLSLFLIGFIETLLANWSLFAFTITNNPKSPLFHISYITTFFWGAIIIGRLLCGEIYKRYSFKFFHIFFSAALFIILLIFAISEIKIGLTGIILLGFLQGSFLPLNLSVGQTRFPTNSLIILGYLFSSFWAGAGCGNMIFSSLQFFEATGGEGLLVTLMLSAALLLFSNTMMAVRFATNDVALK